ncbi:MAG: alpha-L-fucosidase [Thermofilaceae archaeon]|nr:alpha-L-fucosidase [Thermofilaceae archaeon]MDW8003876.1 alpha-L-fucosidase [Thermofilaceae archaeon]
MGNPDEILRLIPYPTHGPFKPCWDSLKSYRVPKWYSDAKLGIFIHWGVYSIPAFGNEWYPRNMYVKGSPEYEFHLKTYGPHTEFGYKDFIPDFTAENWDPDEWARIFQKSGARYVVLVAEHHDGFALWDCSYTRWCAQRVGPRRDLVRELAESVQDRGLIFGVSYHRAEHWFFFEPGTRFDSDVRDAKYADLYGPARPASLNPLEPPGKENEYPDQRFLEDWLLRAAELVEKYRPQVFYFDWWISNPSFEPYLQAFAAYYYNRMDSWGMEGVINYKHAAFRDGTAVLDVERGTLENIRRETWQADTSVCYKSWGYIRDHEYKPLDALLSHLSDVVSKGGNLLLNIGPRLDGSIPDEQVRILRGMGDWLFFNGEAIYASKPWKVFGEGSSQIAGKEFGERDYRFTWGDVRYTCRKLYPYGNVIYAILLGKPEKYLKLRAPIELEGITGDSIISVELLGKPEKRNHDLLRWTIEERCFNIEFSEISTDIKTPIVIRILVR